MQVEHKKPKLFWAVLFGMVSVLIFSAESLRAEKVAYALETEKSKVGFVYQLGQSETKGRMPVNDSNIILDTDNLTRSKIDVSVAANKAKAGLIFATEALKSKSMLDTNQHPNIRFVSDTVTLNAAGRIEAGAVVKGKLTVKGKTLPVQLAASLFRQRGTEARDLSRLSIRLTGEISRADFGVTGFADLVDDRIKLDIIARIKRAN